MLGEPSRNEILEQKKKNPALAAGCWVLLYIHIDQKAVTAKVLTAGVPDGGDGW